ncbi:MAG: hypothetical protein CL947_02045 [Epsilonproteobacteria bacterium]|nr:hypothetical protein [Campylobacterota bacterium]|tara:strand:- start:158 stop:544 length:387 start_codon:yes stop_codon:yes gene_type:complete
MKTIHLIIASVLFTTYCIQSCEPPVINIISQVLKRDQTVKQLDQTRHYFEATIPATTTKDELVDIVNKTPLFQGGVITNTKIYSKLLSQPDLSRDKNGDIIILADVSHDEIKEILYDEFEKFKQQRTK